VLPGVGRIGQHGPAEGVGGFQGLYDTFNRADTGSTVLGTQTLPSGFSGPADGYQVRGPSSGSPAAPGVAETGFIESNMFGGAVNKIVYVTKKIGGTILHMGGVVKWKTAGAGGIATESSLAFLISPAQNPAVTPVDNVIYNAVHVVLTRNGGRVEKIINGAAPVELSNVNWGSPYLPKDTLFPWSFDIDLSGNYVLFYAGKYTTGTDAALIPLLGPYFTFESFSNDATAGSIGRLDQVYARTASGQAAFGETELLSIGQMASSAGWTSSDPPFNFTAGLVVKSAGTAGNLVPTTPIVPTVGANYIVTGERQFETAGTITNSLGGTSGAALDATVGVFAQTLVPANQNNFNIAAGSAADGYLDNFSIRRVF